ncbi:MAG TPA: bifunctional diguanylate cyclase/phosphodiesterase [Candidatus Limnocylindrales bacterium]
MASQAARHLRVVPAHAPAAASEVERLRRRLDRERQARREAERIAEETTRALYREVTSRTRELESLVAMGRDLAKALDSHDFADVIARHAAQAVGFDECGIYTWDQEQDVVTTAGYFPPGRRADLDDVFPLHDYPETRQVLIERRSSVIDVADPDAERSEVRFLEGLGGKLMFQIPMVVNGRAIGTVELMTKTDRSLDAWQLELAQSMANEAGVMLENSRLYSQIRHQAFHDALTGLPNRALLTDRVDHALARGRGTTMSMVALMFVDLDDFKVINDTFGHGVGDAVLRSVAARLQRLTRSGDTVARLSGDEFSVLLEDLSGPTDATSAAARVVEAFEQPIEAGDRAVHVSVSVGVDVGTRSSRTPETLIRNADFAMYNAKRAGKGQFRAYLDGERQAADDDARLRFDLRHAAARDELRVHYQPIVDLRSGAVRSFEALVRWEHPERGLLAPGAFIPIAEETGTIVEIGAWVMAQACTDLRTWQRRHPDLAVSVNLSGRQLQDPRLVAHVRDVLGTTGIDPASLIIEVTETSLVADPSSEAQLRRLKDLGVRLAIDDFGTGYASISYLRRFPVDILKIDREFTSDVASADGSALLAGIVQLGRSLGLETVAEGIEHPEQRVRIAAILCDQGQGFLFARPAPRDEVSRLLATRGFGRLDVRPGSVNRRSTPPRSAAADQLRAAAGHTRR